MVHDAMNFPFVFSLFRVFVMHFSVAHLFVSRQRDRWRVRLNSCSAGWRGCNDQRGDEIRDEICDYGSLGYVLVKKGKEAAIATSSRSTELTGSMRWEAIMTSPAKVAAAIQNAQKSTGPKTEEGKRRSRMNALKHGLTAKTVLLPEEDPAEFQQLLVGWFDSIRPQDKLEASLVERGAYSIWQLDRANRSEAAQLWLKADRHADDQENQVGKEVAGLVRKLLAPPNGRPAAFPGAQATDPEPDGSQTGGAIDFDDLPSELIRRLGTTGLGCQRLLGIWSELGASLEQEGWQTAERYRALRLMGIHPSETYMTTELASILQACRAIDPGAGSLVGEVWNGFVARDALAALEASYERKIAHLPALDQGAARQYLSPHHAQDRRTRGEVGAARRTSEGRRAADTAPNGIRRQQTKGGCCGAMNSPASSFSSDAWKRSASTARRRQNGRKGPAGRIIGRRRHGSRSFQREFRRRFARA